MIKEYRRWDYFKSYFLCKGLNHTSPLLKKGRDCWARLMAFTFAWELQYGVDVDGWESLLAAFFAWIQKCQISFKKTFSKVLQW